MSKDIKIRNLSDAVIIEIDKQAKIRGMSRNEFLQDYLESVFVNEKVKSVYSTLEEIYSVLDDISQKIGFALENKNGN